MALVTAIPVENHYKKPSGHVDLVLILGHQKHTVFHFSEEKE
jgi:hypothetical protein